MFLCGQAETTHTCCLYECTQTVLTIVIFVVLIIHYANVSTGTSGNIRGSVNAKKPSALDFSGFRHIRETVHPKPCC